jgi:hypothetical protein
MKEKYHKVVAIPIKLLHHTNIVKWEAVCNLAIVHMQLK